MERTTNNRTSSPLSRSGSGSQNGVGCRNGGEALMRKIQEVDFAIYDTVLFLDAYPCSEEALAHYHSLLNTRNMLVAEYERAVGPLTMNGNESTTTWSWTKTPWPWEI